MHSHDHSHSHTSGKNIALAFFLNAVFAVVELIGGILTNSLAIISDALHDTGDSAALGLAWFLEKKSQKAGDEKYTFGYKRFSTLGALINSIILIAGSALIIYNAIPRIINPVEPHAEGMIYFAAAGILINGFAALRLRKGKSLNEKVVSWHLLEDVLGWVAVMIVAIVLLYEDLYILDPLLSLLITLYILYNALKNLRPVMEVFLQKVPKGFSIEEVEDEMLQYRIVASVHHTHIWSEDGVHHVLTTHAVIKRDAERDEIIKMKRDLKERMRDRGINHVTIEMELEDEGCFMYEKIIEQKES